MLAFDTKVDETEIIVEACLNRYHALGIEAEAISWSSISLDDVTVCPVIKTDRRLDWIVARDTPSNAQITVFALMADEGWTVHALVPMEQLGAAHAELRGAPVRLQGWWIDDGGVHFGRPEIP